MHLNRIDSIWVSLQWGPRNVIVQEILVNGQVHFVLLSAYIFQRNPITPWDSANEVEECGFSIFPLRVLLKLVRLSRFGQGLRIRLKLVICFVASNEFTDLVDGERSLARVTSKANFISGPLDKCLYVFARDEFEFVPGLRPGRNTFWSVHPFIQLLERNINARCKKLPSKTWSAMCWAWVSSRKRATLSTPHAINASRTDRGVAATSMTNTASIKK